MGNCPSGLLSNGEISSGELSDWGIVLDSYIYIYIYIYNTIKLTVETTGEISKSDSEGPELKIEMFKNNPE